MPKMSLLMRQIYHVTETAFAKLAAVEAMPKLALKVASPSTATPMLIESICVSRGVPTINVDSIVIDTTYRIFATKQS